MDRNNVAKVVVVGATGVGKTSIIERCVLDKTTDDHEPTVGTGFCKLVLNDATFEIWDTAGQERFRSLTRSFFKDAQAALFVFDVNKIETLNDLEFYAQTLRDITDPESVVVGLIGNKSDLPPDSRVSRGVIDANVQKLGASFYLLTSVRTGEGIDEIFPALLQQPSLHFFGARKFEIPHISLPETAPKKACNC
jgi:small GTP-binding protein